MDIYCAVRKAKSSKQLLVSNQSQLVDDFGQLIQEEGELRWQFPPGQPAHGQLSAIELALDGRSQRFTPVYRLRPGISELESILSGWTDSTPPLLVVPELRSRILEFCRQKRFAAVDLNGRAYLRAEGLLVDRGASPGRNFRYEFEPSNVFFRKSARIIRRLLSDRDRVWTQSELIENTKVSSGLVSRVVNHLIRQGYLEKQSTRAFRLSDPLGLLDAWAKADDIHFRTLTVRYTVFGASPLEIAQQLRDWAKEKSSKIAFTQWIAAWLRHPHTEPVITSAYVTGVPDNAALERLGLRPVRDAGKVCLLSEADEGIFQETRIVNGLPLVSDAQIFLDLQKSGLRGPEAAAALRDWDGFCRP